MHTREACMVAQTRTRAREEFTAARASLMQNLRLFRPIEDAMAHTLRTLLLGSAMLFLGTSGLAAGESPTRLLREPTLSPTHLAFVYSGEIWIAGRNGESPHRITSDGVRKMTPRFSPDGRWIAYSASYEGNIDVFVVPAAGGVPRRLTWHPDPDYVCGWSPDGRRVLFASQREVGNSRSRQLYEVPVEGGLERKVMEAVAVEGAWSPDGTRLAYRPTIMAYSGTSGWRRHRGGDTPPIWILDFANHTVEEIPHVNASDSNPMWVGTGVAFLSDRSEGATNLFLYDTRSRSVRQLTHEKTWDVRNAGTDGRVIAIEAAGRLQLVDPDHEGAVPLAISLSVDAPEARPQWKDVAGAVSDAGLSPSGKRALVTARGAVFSVPVKDGSVRILAGASGSRYSDATWSGDGKKVAYIADEEGRRQLVVRDALGLEPPVRYPLPAAGWHQILAWSPDGERIALDDRHLNLLVLELGKGSITKVDSSLRRIEFAISFSGDGQWLAYTVGLANHLTQVRLHHFADGRTANLADAMVQTGDPVFADGNLLYFTASIDAALSAPGLDLSTQERPLRKALYVAVLAADGRSPLAPRTGDEEARKDDAKDGAKEARKDGKPGDAGAGEGAAKATRVDLAGLSDRLVPVPVPERNYSRLLVGADGSLYYVAQRQPGSVLEAKPDSDETAGELYRFSMEDRAEKLVRSGITDAYLSGDRKKLLLRTGKAKFEVADAGEKLDAKPLDLSGLRLFVDPRREWAQMFDEAWRMEREFFYDPALHGIDWEAVRQRYAALLASATRRDDLNEILIEMIGELQVGHNRLSGGDMPAPHASPVGLLGADLRVEKGLVRIARIYRGDQWNPFRPGPLAAPGLDIQEGDALLEVNGRPLSPTANLFEAFDGTAGNQTTLLVSRDGSAKSAHRAVVVPVPVDRALRQWDWIEHNRAYVEKRGAGRIAYVYLPDTAGQGFTYFNRMFFAQSDREAVIVDDRRNSGGQAANYVLDVLDRKLLSGWKDRDGLTWNTPGGAIYGPKVMLIDQDAGSGGDFLPYGFRRLGLGKLIGTRTWGGLIGIFANPELIDGAQLTVPFFRMYTPEGRWAVENEGVAPDLEVRLDPLAVNAGRDPQLDAAIDSLLAQLGPATAASNPAPAYPKELGK